jgi:Spy/CpxP family protein refolding chaperone
MTRWLGRIVVVALAVAGGTTVGAQQPAPPDPERGVTPAEVQRMFDAYALVQAQDQLKLTDDQFSQFLARFKALQEVRRRYQMERNRAIQELVRLTRQDKAEDGLIRDRLKELKDIETRSVADIRTSYDAVDQVLDLRQQAKFRVFEEFMERRKIELVTRARQNNRLRNRPQ